MNIFKGLSFDKRQRRRGQSRARQSLCRLLRVEPLEQRRLLTTTLYLDFGEGLPAGGLDKTLAELASEPINGPDGRTTSTAPRCCVAISTSGCLLNYRQRQYERAAPAQLGLHRDVTAMETGNFS